MKKFAASVLVLASLAVTSSASAALLAGDDFSYVGALTANGWGAHSGAGNKVVMADGSVATLDQSGGSGEDVSLAFAALGATDKVYAGFDINLPSSLNPGGVNPDAQGLYFAHFKNATTNFRGRTGVLAPAAAGDYALAINADNGDLGLGVSWASDLSFDTTYRVIISWDAGTGESELWLDAALETDTSISHTGGLTGDLIEGFALRQSNDYTGMQLIDNVLVGTTFADVVPEPASLALLALGAMTVIRRKR